jgi:spermidine synthase
MKQPSLIKRFFSYFAEVPVGEFTSEHNHVLTVLLDRGRYKLVTKGAIYSFSDLYSNYSMSFERLKWKDHPVKSCLVLGLGLGSIPDMLVNRFKKDIQFTAVEIDDQVIRLAMEFVLRPGKIPVQVFSADAASFLQWHQGTYDMICSDVFIGDRIPKNLQTEEALYAMKSMLNPRGVLLYNRLSRFEPDIKTSLTFQEEVFLKVFPAGGYLDVEGNWMFVNDMQAFSER